MEHSLLECPKHQQERHTALTAILTQMTPAERNHWDTSQSLARAAIILCAYKSPLTHEPIMTLIRAIDANRRLNPAPPRMS
jgi:hypothetical protein